MYDMEISYLRCCNVSITDGGIYSIAVELASCGMIYLPSFMKIGIGIQSILRFCLRNFKGCSVGITDVRGL
jgi:hypothetical protein